MQLLRTKWPPPKGPNAGCGHHCSFEFRNATGPKSFSRRTTREIPKHAPCHLRKSKLSSRSPNHPPGQGPRTYRNWAINCCFSLLRRGAEVANRRKWGPKSGKRPLKRTRQRPSGQEIDQKQEFGDKQINRGPKSRKLRPFSQLCGPLSET